MKITTEVRNEVKTAIIDIDGPIGEVMFEEGTTKQGIRTQLREISDIDAEKIIVNISSPGGSVDHGLAIHDLLASHEAEVETNVIGMTASASTVIAMAGNTRKMSDNALMLIHQARIFMLVNDAKIEDIQDSLRTIDKRVAKIYAKRSGESVETFLNKMAEKGGDGVWLTAEEALELGLIDEITEPFENKVETGFFNQYNLPTPDTHNNTDPKEDESSLTDKLQVNLKLTPELEEKFDEIKQVIEGENLVVSKVRNDDQATDQVDDDADDTEQDKLRDSQAVREREIELLQLKSN